MKAEDVSYLSNKRVHLCILMIIMKITRKKGKVNFKK